MNVDFGLPWVLAFLALALIPLLRQPAQLRRATRQRDRSHADPARVASVVRFSLAQPSAVTAVSALVIPRKPRRSSGPVQRSCQAPLETIGLPALLPRRPCRIV